jgi:hypothetical protein
LTPFGGALFLPHLLQFIIVESFGVGIFWITDRIVKLRGKECLLKGNMVSELKQDIAV